MKRQRTATTTGSLQDTLGIKEIGEGYVLRDDGVAVGIAEISPPDLRLHDDESLFFLLQAYEAVLRASADRCMIYTYAVPPDLRPLMSLLQDAQQRAQDLTSYMVLNALTSYLEGALRYLSSVPTVRWILAVPSEEPEAPPRGTWGELYPSAIVGKLNKLNGDPAQEAMARLRRLVNAFASLGTEPQPRVLTAAEIRTLLAMTLDPIGAQAHPITLADTMVRPLQVAASLPPPRAPKPAPSTTPALEPKPVAEPAFAPVPTPAVAPASVAPTARVAAHVHQSSAPAPQAVSPRAPWDLAASGSLSGDS